MNPTLILELFNLATILVEKLLPILEESLKSGEISVDKQTELRKKIGELKAKLESGDLGSHWTVPDRN